MTSRKPLRALELVAPRESLAPKAKIAVVIPVYNEEKNIEGVLLEIEKLRGIEPAWEIIPIIVNDGSTDQTERVLDRISERHCAQVVNLPLNIGIGRAVQCGWRLATRLGADVALQLDGDGQHPALEIPKIVAPVLQGKADVVVGSRYCDGAGGNVSSILRQVGTTFFSWLLRVLVGVRVRDTTSGFRAFSRDATDFLARYYPDDYPEVQAYVPLARKRFTIAEVPVTMRPRVSGSSSITTFQSVYYVVKVAFATLMDVIRKLPDRHSLEEKPVER